MMMKVVEELVKHLVVCIPLAAGNAVTYLRNIHSSFRYCSTKVELITRGKRTKNKMSRLIIYCFVTHNCRVSNKAVSKLSEGKMNASGEGSMYCLGRQTIWITTMYITTKERRVQCSSLLLD